MTPQEAFNELRTNTEYFLKYYPINIFGCPGPHHADQANTKQVYIHKRDPSAPGSTPSKKVGHYGATRPGRTFSWRKHEISSFKIQPANVAPAGVSRQLIIAHSVPMHFENTITINALDAYLLDNAQDGVMVTGQLSGCTFCVAPAGGNNLACTHIKPVGAAGGGPLQTNINNNGAFSTHPGPLTTFGRNDYPAYATVIGVRAAGTWRIYAQCSNDQCKTITSVYRIYPAPRHQIR